jgi:hypothetical protein
MRWVFAIILVAVCGWFVFAAVQLPEGISLTQFGLPLYYLTVAFVALVNAILFAAANFTDA